MIFIDTGPFIARYLKNDQYHEQALAVWQSIINEGTRCLTSNFVIDETLTLIGRRAGNEFAAERGSNIYASKLITVLRPELNDELQSIKTFVKYSDQAVSFTDCISFELMRKQKITEVFTFDSHFEIAGFSILSR